MLYKETASYESPDIHKRTYRKYEENLGVRRDVETRKNLH